MSEVLNDYEQLKNKFRGLNDLELARLGELPAGVPTLGLHNEEVDSYIEYFHDFKNSILDDGNLYGDSHGWFVVGRHLGSLLVHTGISFEESTEDLTDSELNLIDVFEESGFLETSEVQDGPNLFVIDLDWVVKAWTIGVNRFGLMWYGKSDMNQYDTIMQYTLWGFRNQG